jgi:peptide/nickel transport system substrate-binding protein
MRVSRRGFLRLIGSTTSLVLLAACGGASGAVAPAPPAPASAPAAPPAVPAASAAPFQAPSGAAQPAEPQPGAVAPVASGSAPKGRITYAWHTTISPAWLDPQENPPQVTPYNFQYALHDALVKHMPGKPMTPSLAESYEVAPDFTWATFKLRPGITFHDGSPVTSEDVKFSFEAYHGANATILHDKTASIEAPDTRTVKFTFKEPFLDFMMLYGTPASGAGWVVPQAYYAKVGPSGFKTNPIGAGPYRFVHHQAGVEIEFEAFTDYWRKVPNVKTLVMKGVPEGATRVALLQTGEVDFINLVPGELLDAIRQDSRLQLAPTKAGTIWLDFPGFDKPDSPFHDIRVRQAVSLAIDRQSLNDAEMGGLAPPEGNWIPEDYPGALQRPQFPFDLAKARELMAAAGKADGFDVENVTPLPPYFSIGERIVSQLRAINIRSKVNTMERAAYYERLAPGPNRLQGIIVAFSGAPGDAAARIRENVACQGGFSGTCLPEIDDRMKRYDASRDPNERQKLLDEVQNYILDNNVLVPVVRQSFIGAVGPRIANKASEIVGAIPQYVYPGPFEDILLKEG